MIIQGFLLIFGDFLVTSSADLVNVFGEYQKLAGGLILCGLALGWLVVVVVVVVVVVAVQWSDMVHGI